MGYLLVCRGMPNVFFSGPNMQTAGRRTDIEGHKRGGGTGSNNLNHRYTSNDMFAGGPLNGHSEADQRAADQNQKTTTSSNVYANGRNQNAGNVLTDRSTTRVIRPPGGASTIQLG